MSSKKVLGVADTSAPGDNAALELVRGQIEAQQEALKTELNGFKALLAEVQGLQSEAPHDPLAARRWAQVQLVLQRERLQVVRIQQLAEAMCQDLQQMTGAVSSQVQAAPRPRKQRLRKFV